jgi:hypothetical protein
LDNIGLGFWTHQLQAAGAWYPFETAARRCWRAPTRSITKWRTGTSPRGERFSLNWGVSQYLPITKDQTWLAEIGASGYSQWQVEEDSGSDVAQIVNAQLNAKDEVHAAGIQAGLTFVRGRQP